jgi:hypothetical protein
VWHFRTQGGKFAGTDIPSDLLVALLLQILLIPFVELAQVLPRSVRVEYDGTISM